PATYSLSLHDALPIFAHRARGRVGPERFVICAAIVIAGEPEASRRPEDEESRSEEQPGRPPARLGSEPGVGRIAEEDRRVERREDRKSTRLNSSHVAI